MTVTATINAMRNFFIVVPFFTAGFWLAAILHTQNAQVQVALSLSGRDGHGLTAAGFRRYFGGVRSVMSHGHCASDDRHSDDQRDEELFHTVPFV